jgi:hypothetical protein
MKRHTILVFAAIAAMLIVSAPPALAQASPDEAAAAAGDRGYYIEAGVGADEARISDAVARAGNEGYRFFVILLDDDPPGGAVTFAAAVMDRIGEGTVLVLSASQEGMDSTDFSQSELDGALDAGFEASAGGGDAAYVDAVVATLTGAAPPVTPSTPATSSGGGSKTGLFILLGFVALLVLLVWWAIRRQRTSSLQSEQKMVEEARKEIKSQLDAMANTILDISDQVSVSDSKEDNQYLEQAGATYGTALEEFEHATDLHALEDMSDRLDEARWQLDAAAALAVGREVPPKPVKEVRHQCFFDPNHPEATEVAEITTSAGTQKVQVCKADADKLRAGQQPTPRMIRVGGRSVPAPMAPRSHGGGGMDWLSVFSVVLGGMAQQRSYDWSRSRRSSGGLFGSGGGWSGSSGTSTSSPRPTRTSSAPRARAGRSRRRRR